MMFKTLVTTAAALAALVSSAAATMAPTYPSPGTIWTTGESYTLTWADNGASPNFASGWTNFKIQFMTGSNFNQTALAPVASGLDATSITSYTWTVPEVDPNSAVYFFMYTNAAGESAWTTRFGIIAKPGDTLTPETEKMQPDGAAIPWGNGKLATSAKSGAATAAASSVAAKSAAVSTSASISGSVSAAAVNEEITHNSGVEALRVPLAQAGLVIVAVIAIALA